MFVFSYAGEEGSLIDNEVTQVMVETPARLTEVV